MRTLLAVLSLAMVLTATGCIPNSLLGNSLFGPDDQAIQQAQTATVADFVETYRKNAVKANNDYAGKWVKLRGKITGIGKVERFNEPDDYMVTLQDDTGKTREVIGCIFTPDKLDQIESLTNGSQIIIAGRIGELDPVVRLPVLEFSRVIR